MVVLLSIILFILPSLLSSQYAVFDEPAYLANFNNLMTASYKEPIPANIQAICKGKGSVSITQNVSITASTTAQDLVSQCNVNTRCIINAGVTVQMNTDLNMGALEVNGALVWTDGTQVNNEQYLCAGYIQFNPDSSFNMNLSQKKGYIYIKNNGVSSPRFGQRFLVAERPAQYDMFGRPMRRTWSLLSKSFLQGGNNITLMHNIADMGWQIGDRIAIAPTTYRASGTTQSFFIKSFNGNNVQLSATIDLVPDAVANQDFTGIPGSVQSEVINLSRNILITGDDFQNIPCGTGECTCSPDIGRTQCTVGLHTMFMGTALYRVKNVKVEKCGQRGILARYCMHFHQALKCSNCLIEGSVVEHSHQRGIVIHGTDITSVAHNVLHDVRGGGIYIEDGNELYNNVEYNVVLCPWSFTGPMQGCTIPGTDNREADTSQNQAAIWSLGHTNNFIGNRASNTFNGLHFMPSFMNAGRGFVLNQICARFTPLGRVIGNTLHGCGRFGTYFVDSNWPRHIPGGTIDDNGITGLDCPAFDAVGNDLGFPATILDNVDYHNEYVGSYAMGDIQFSRHTSFDSSNILYWKDTKNFADGCSSHHVDNIFQGPGIMQLPDGAATVIFERNTFKGNILLQANHHCGLGVSGMLCNPVYMLQNPKSDITSDQWVDFLEEDVSGDPNLNVNWIGGGMFVLSPDDIPNNSGNFLPAGYVALTSNSFPYLLSLEGGQVCTTSVSLGLGKRFNNGILCKKTLRRLNLYSDSYSRTDRGITIKLQVFDSNTNAKLAEAQVPFQYTTDKKQGFTIPVIPDLAYKYVVSKSDGSGIPLTWIIEFSDPVIGNRWTPDQIRLQVIGRTCPDITTSQHDRGFIYGDSLDNCMLKRDRGACSIYPDMPPVNCKAKPKLAPITCPDLCKENCTAKNAFCDCGTQVCRCEPGFYGDNCEFDICSESRCENGGKCSARYLGGDLSVSKSACICEGNFKGETCSSNPCDGVTCSGNGKCVALGPNSYKCECNSPWTGADCTQSCEGQCVGTFPYMCSMTEDYSYCMKGVYQGCNYNNQTGNSQYCCVSNCYACERVTCPEPENNCYESSKCVDGNCLPFVMRPDGSVCHSATWGTCKQGQCVAGESPTDYTFTTLPFNDNITNNNPNSLPGSGTTAIDTSQIVDTTDTTAKNTKTFHPTQNVDPTDTTKIISPTQIHFNETDSILDNNNQVFSQFEPWKIGVIVAGSVVGVALIVAVLVVMLVPSIKSKVFAKQKSTKISM